MKRHVIRQLCLTILGAILCVSMSAQWERTHGPPGGNIRALAVDDDVQFAGSYSSFVYRSSDKGANWTPVGERFMYSEVMCLAKIGSTVFAGTRDSGVVRSTDNGLSWASSSNGITESNVYNRPIITSLAVSGTTIFAGTRDGIFRSHDNGENWSKLNTGSHTRDVSELLVTAGVIYAVTESGVIRSFDNGETWDGDAVDLDGYAIYSITSDGPNLFVSVYPKGILRSTDTGRTWTRISEERSRVLVTTATKLIAGTEYGVVTSADYGATWAYALTSVDYNGVLALAVHGNDVYAGTMSEGVFHSSDNGEYWSIANTGIDDGSSQSMTSFAGDLFVSTLSGVWRTSDGSAWTTSNTGLEGQSYVTAFFSIDSAILAGTHTNNGDSADAYRSEDQGHTWTPSISGNPCYGIECFTAIGNVIIAGGHDCVLKSTDNGDTWTTILTGLEALSGYWPINGLAASGGNLFAASHGGGVYISSNLGELWTPIDDEHGQRFVYGVTAIGNNVFFYSADGLFRTTNNGDDWTQITAIPTVNITHLSAWRNNLFLVTETDVYVSSDNGRSWTQIGQGLENLRPDEIQVHGDHIYIATFAAGVWRRPLGEVVSSLEQDPYPESDLLARPNPFDVSTNLSFSLASSAFTTLKIFNMQGQCVATLFSGDLKAGPHTIQYQPQASGGLYYVQLLSGGRLQTQPLLIMR